MDKTETQSQGIKGPSLQSCTGFNYGTFAELFQTSEFSSIYCDTFVKKNLKGEVIVCIRKQRHSL